MVVCGVLLVAACGIDGSSPYAGWLTVTDSEGVYRLRYLAPPWTQEESAPGDATVRLVVPPEWGSLDAGAPPPYRLTAQLVSGLAQPVLLAAVAGITGGELLGRPSFSTVSGDVGFSAVVEAPTHILFYWLVALVVPGGRVLLVRLEMNEDPRGDLEAAAMLRAIDVRPFVD